MGYMYMSHWRYGEVEEAIKQCSGHDGVAAKAQERESEWLVGWPCLLLVRVLFVSDAACGVSGKDSERMGSREWTRKRR